MNRLHNFVLNTICISNQHWSSFSEIELHASPHRLSTLDANSPHTSRWLAMLTSCCYPAMSANHWYLELGLTAQVAFRSFLSLEGKTSQRQRRRPHTPLCRAAADTRRTFSRHMGCAGSTPATKETGGSSGKSPGSRSPSSSLCRAIRAVRIGVFLGKF